MRPRRIVVAALAGLVAACASAAPFRATSWHWMNGYPPPEHRPSPLACAPRPEPTLRLHVQPPLDAGPDELVVEHRQQCATSGDCNQHPRGYCNAFRMKGITTSYCKYDACESDADCAPGKVCRCGEEWDEHSCVTAGCRKDDECGEGHWCAYSKETPETAAGYFCHAPDDACVERHLDCHENEDCTFVAARGRWSCTSMLR